MTAALPARSAGLGLRRAMLDALLAAPAGTFAISQNPLQVPRMLFIGHMKNSSQDSDNTEKRRRLLSPFVNPLNGSLRLFLEGEQLGHYQLGSPSERAAQRARRRATST